MENENIENLIREVFILNRGKRLQEDKTDCLSEEVVCDYLMSKLPPSKKEDVENHLSVCPLCRLLISTAVELEEWKKMELKDRILEKGNIAVEAMKISVKWVKGRLELIKTSAEYIPFWDALRPILVRSDLQKATTTLPIFKKDFPEYKVITQIEEEEEEGKCSIRCYLCPFVEKRLKPTIRFELIRGQRVIYSYILKDDTIVFKEITPGKYLIKVRAGEDVLALISIEIFNNNGDIK